MTPTMKQPHLSASVATQGVAFVVLDASRFLLTSAG
jgi:hypothetical protein